MERQTAATGATTSQTGGRFSCTTCSRRAGPRIPLLTCRYYTATPTDSRAEAKLAIAVKSRALRALSCHTCMGGASDQCLTVQLLACLGMLRRVKVFGR